MRTQNHIHLDATIFPSEENAPLVKWKVTDRLDRPYVQLGIKVGITGKVLVHRLENQNGTVLYNDYKYTLLVDTYYGYTTAERVAMLKSWIGQRLYLVDSIHPDDGNDHTAAVLPVYVSDVPAFEVFDQGLTRYYAEIELVEAKDPSQ